MAQLIDGDNEYSGIGSIELTSGTSLEYGVVATSGSIDLTSGGLHTIITVPTGVNMLVKDIIIRLVDNTGITGTFSGSIGTGAGANNIVAQHVYTGWNQLVNPYIFSISGLGYICSPADVISLNIVGVFGGSSVLGEVILMGFRFN